MFLRVILVGAVASLGFDLPQGISLDAWAHSGRIWWHARAAEFEARHGIALAGTEGTPSPDRPAEAEAPPPDLDAAFSTVIEDVVAAFAVDGSLDRIEGPGASSQLVAGGDDCASGPDYADALNRWADGLSEPAEPAPLADEAGALASDPGDDPIVAPMPGDAGSAFASAIDPVNEPTPPPDSSSDSSVGVVDEGAGDGPARPGEHRLVTAVQLTGQALQAWLALVQPAGPTVPPAF